MATMLVHEQKSSKEFRNLQRFFQTYKMETKSGDPNTDIIDVAQKKTYTYRGKPQLRNLFMSNVGQVVNARQTLNLLERQDPEANGIYVDLDMYHKDNAKLIVGDDLQTMVQSMMHGVLSVVNPTPDGLSHFRVHAFVTRRKKITYDDKKGMYKDGIHIYIPSIMLPKDARRYLVSVWCKDKVIEEATNNELKSVDVIDIMAATNPVMMFGSSKPGGVPYDLTNVYNYTFTNSGQIRMTVDCTAEVMTRWDMANLPYEMSLRHERPNGMVNKRTFTVRADCVEAVRRTGKKINGMVQNNDSLSILAVSDPNAAMKLDLLNILGPERYTKYENWWKVVTMVSYWGKDWKPAAREFTAKAPKHSSKHARFETIWNDGINTPKEQRMPFGISMLMAMAKQDNPQEYVRITNESVISTLLDLLLAGKLTRNQHYSIAKLMHKMNGHLFFADIMEGEKDVTWWYLCVDPESEDAYKYVKCEDDHRLSIYISEILMKLFEKARDNIHWRIDNSTNEKAIKYYEEKLKVLNGTMEGLNNNSCKTSILREAKAIYRKVGKSRLMDKSEIHTGTTNGVLEMGNYPKLITSVSGDVMISRRLNARYVGIDPTDDNQIFVYSKHWDMFPKGEKDAYMYSMMYDSSILWNRVQSSLFFKKLGNGSNGKSFWGETRSNLCGNAGFLGYGAKIPSQWLFEPETNSDSATAALYQLVNARYAYFSETDKSQDVQTAKIKKLTSQERMMFRQLYAKAILAKHNALFSFLSNWPFNIKTTEHGIWRRMLVYWHKIIFCKGADPSKNECEEDSSLNRGTTSEPWFLNSLLSILSMFACILKLKYNNDITEHVSPTIKHETQKYRESQDTIHRFITQHIASVNNGIELDAYDIVDHYIMWHNEHYKNTSLDRLDVVHMLSNSVIGNGIRQKDRSVAIVGYRFVPRGSKPGVGEKWAVDTNAEAKRKKMAIQFVDNDTGFQSYVRVWWSWRCLLRKTEDWCPEFEEEDRLMKIKIIKKANALGIKCTKFEDVFKQRKAPLWPTPLREIKRMQLQQRRAEATAKKMREQQPGCRVEIEGKEEKDDADEKDDDANKKDDDADKKDDDADLPAIEHGSDSESDDRRDDSDSESDSSESDGGGESEPDDSDESDMDN